MSNVKGFAGAARIRQLKTRADLRAAEKHGKRLDKSGKERSVRDAKPVTRSGLDVVDQYDKHVEGCFVQKNSTMAMHVLIQFPKILIDENDPDLMLDHAISFCRHVFGENSVFADRIDRDEKNEHVVDVFVAPTYLKVTKRTSKPAVSSTRHLRDLAKKHKEPTVPQGYGRALQTEFFEYLRDTMKLEGVMRGEKKVIPGSDFKTAEQQRLDELASLRKEALELFDHNQEERAANLERQIELDDREKEMRQRKTVLDEQASEQAAAATKLAGQRRELESGHRELAGKLSEVEQARNDNAAMASELEEAEKSLKDRETDGVRRDDARRAKQAELQTKQRELDERERFVDAFEAGIDAVSNGTLYFGQAKDGREGLLSRWSPERSKELGAQIQPAFGRVRTIARICSEAVSKQVDAEVAKEREAIASLMQAYQMAIEAARSHAEDFLHLISKLRKEVRKRVMVDLDLQKGEEAARKTVSEGATDSPEGLSLEQLEHLRRLREGSQIS